MLSDDGIHPDPAGLEHLGARLIAGSSEGLGVVDLLIKAVTQRRRHWVDERSRAVATSQQPVTLQRHDGFPYRRSTGAEMLGQCILPCQ